MSISISQWNGFIHGRRLFLTVFIIARPTPSLGTFKVIFLKVITLIEFMVMSQLSFTDAYDCWHGEPAGINL